MAMNNCIHTWQAQLFDCLMCGSGKSLQRVRVIYRRNDIRALEKSLKRLIKNHHIRKCLGCVTQSSFQGNPKKWKEWRVAYVSFFAGVCSQVVAPTTSSQDDFYNLEGLEGFTVCCCWCVAMNRCARLHERQECCFSCEDKGTIHGGYLLPNPFPFFSPPSSLSPFVPISIWPHLCLIFAYLKLAMGLTLSLLISPARN